MQLASQQNNPPKEVSAKITAEIPKDLTMHALPDIARLLRQETSDND